MICSPIIIIGAPRSGTTILQRCLAMHPDVWHLRAESHAILEGPFHPIETGRMSNRCVAEDAANEERVARVQQAFYECAINLNCVFRDPAPLLSASSSWERVVSFVAVKAIGALSKHRKPERIRFLEKTPKNTLRVSLLERLFPGAFFVWNRRRPEENIDSLVAGWKFGQRLGEGWRRRFARAGYPVAQQLHLQDYHQKWWRFAWVPEWQRLQGKTVADVAAWQYYQCNRIALEDFASIDDERIFVVWHEQFVREPHEHIAKILQWAALPSHPVVTAFANALPRVNSTDQKERAPDELRYPKQVRQAIEHLPELAKLRKRLGY